MIKLLVCCASGSGTSMMMKLAAEKACKALGVEAKVSHMPIAEAKSAARNYDIPGRVCLHRVDPGAGIPSGRFAGRARGAQSVRENQ